MSRPSSPIDVATRTFVFPWEKSEIAAFCSFWERPEVSLFFEDVFLLCPRNTEAETGLISFSALAIVEAVSLNWQNTIIFDLGFLPNCCSVIVASSAIFGCSIFCWRSKVRDTRAA